MIEIKKKNHEPNELLAFRKQPYATYKGIPGACKEAVQNSLLKEQGYLCAYCMRRIPEKGKQPPVSIEHWDAQSTSDDAMALAYNNMFAVCSGNRGCNSKDDMTCDAKKGNASLKVNPCRPETLLDIHYCANGKIYSDDPIIDDDLNIRLNLNCEGISLPLQRKMAVDELIKMVRAAKGSHDIKVFCRNQLKKIRNAEKKPPYAGILIDWLEQHI